MSARLLIFLGLFFFNKGISQEQHLIGKKLVLTMEMKSTLANNDPVYPSSSNLTSLVTTVNTITDADDREVSMDTYIKRLAGSKTIGETLQTYDTDDGATLYHPALKDYLTLLNKTSVLVFKDDKIQQKGIPLLDKMETFSGNTGIYDEYRNLILKKLPTDYTIGYQWTQKSRQDDIRREANYSVTKITNTSIEVQGLIEVNGNRSVITNGNKSKIHLEGNIQMTALYDPVTYLLKSARYQTESKIREESNRRVTNFTAQGSRIYSVQTE